MRAASPRKSSTSSARPRRPRARYLGIEVAGEPIPTPAAWTDRLHRALAAAGTPQLGFRLIRSGDHRAVARVDRSDAAAARCAWDSPRGDVEARDRLRTVRTWGTLVRAKAWLAASQGGPHGDHRAD